MNLYYNGTTYDLPEGAIEAAYRFREKQYRREDAKRHLLVFIFDDPDVDPADLRPEDQENLEAFEKEYTSYAEAAGMIDAFVERFESLHDCNVAENVIWEEVIKTVLLEEPRNCPMMTECVPGACADDDEWFAIIRWAPEDAMAAAAEQGITMTREQAVKWWTYNENAFKNLVMECGQTTLSEMDFSPETYEY